MSEKKPQVFCYAKFDLSALLYLARQMRDVPCTCDQTQRPMSGALNWALLLTFQDGVEWIFRSPLKLLYISPETTSDLLASEVATLRYIRQNSLIPVPEIFDFRYVHLMHLIKDY